MKKHAKLQHARRMASAGSMESGARWVLAGLLATILLDQAVQAQGSVVFNYSGPGEVKSMKDWGVDTAWPSADNMRQCVAHMGADEIDVVRINFFTDEPLQPNGDIGSNSKSRIAQQLALAAMSGDKPIALTPVICRAIRAAMRASRRCRSKPIRK